MNWFDLVVIILILLAFVKGFFSGLIMQIASLAGIVLGAVFAGKLSGFIAPYIISFVEVSPHIIGPLSYIIAFIAILVALFFAGKLLDSLVDIAKMSTLNKLGGAFFSAAKWLVVFSIILNLVAELDQNKHIIKEDIREQSHTYPLVSELSKKVVPYLRFDWFNQLLPSLDQNTQ